MLVTRDHNLQLKTRHAGVSVCNTKELPDLLRKDLKIDGQRKRKSDNNDTDRRNRSRS
jgi:hypothetical protein